MRTLILLAVLLALMIVWEPREPAPYVILAAILLFLLVRAYFVRFGTEKQKVYWANIDSRVSAFAADNRVATWILVLFGVIVLVGVIAGVVLPER